METENNIKYIFKNLGSGLIKTLVSIVFSVLGITIIVHNIGLSKYGLISTTLIFTGFSGLLDLGLSKSLILFKNSTDRNMDKEVFSIYIINIVISLTLIMIAFILYAYVDFNLFSQYSQRENNIIIFVSFLLLGLEMFNNLMRAILEACMSSN